MNEDSGSICRIFCEKSYLSIMILLYVGCYKHMCCGLDSHSCWAQIPPRWCSWVDAAVFELIWAMSLTPRDWIHIHKLPEIYGCTPTICPCFSSLTCHLQLRRVISMSNHVVIMECGICGDSPLVKTHFGPYHWGKNDVLMTSVIQL